MFDSRTAFVVLLAFFSTSALAQPAAPPSAPASDAASRPRKEPPPNAYSDCKGKKAGDSVQHQTPEGVVAANCVESPKGLVARPVNPPPDRPVK